MSTRTGILLLVSGPSGSGKTTLCRRLADEKEAVYAISCTTRAPREGEQNGHDYHFLSREEFEQKIENDDFLEYAEVHGNYYGTLKSEVIDHLEEGTDIVIDIDVQGADLIRQCSEPTITRALTTLFVRPHTDEDLLARLTGRGTDSDDVIALRMKNARTEIESWQKYDYQLLSTTREADYAQFKSLIIAERLRVLRISRTND